MNELPVMASCLCAKISGIATWQTLQLAGRKRMVVSMSKKKRVCTEIDALSLHFYHKWIKLLLIRGKCNFLFELPKYVMKWTDEPLSLPKVNCEVRLNILI